MSFPLVLEEGLSTMAFRTDPRFAQPGLAVPATDEGLRSFMLSVYNYMGLGLAITGIVALAVASRW